MELDYVKLRDFKPALTGYIKDAELMLKSSDFPDEDTVHDVRVLMKKARAVLRITASQLDTGFTERENLALREVGRLLNLTRETTVLRRTLRDLKKRHPDLFKKLTNIESVSNLLKKPAESFIPTDENKIDIDQIVTILNKTGYHMRFEPMANLNPQLLLKGLEVTYNRVVNDYLISRNYTKTSNLHELRKSSKDFLYQLWFFRPLNVPVIKNLEKKLDSMTQNLGKYNDLAQLIKGLGYKYEYTANPPELDELALIIKEEQDRYLLKIWPVAHKLFCPGQRLVNILGFKLLII